MILLKELLGKAILKGRIQVNITSKKGMGITTAFVVTTSYSLLK